MSKIILKSSDKRQLIEIHNRPYLVDTVFNKVNIFPISLFLHNDPKTMKGSKFIRDRKSILEKCAAVFCVSRYIKNQFLYSNLDHNQKVHVLYNGVNRKLKKFPSKKKEILFVGRLVFEKGVDLYVEVVKSIAPYYPDWNFGLTGSFRLGDNNNVNSYASKVIKNFNNIISQAKFYGFKDHDFVQDKMKAASIIIIPSLWEERFGLVAPEAMSNGIAIIASKVGGIPEIIKDNGILIENIDFKKLEKTLMGVINNNKSRLAYQKKACENFQLKSTFSSKQLYNYRKIIYRHHF